MPDNLLTASSIASFKGIELHRYLVSFTDSRGPRVVEHSVPKRDSAQQEVLGRRPHRTEWQLTFTGTKWLPTFKQLVAAIDADPSGLLVHPIYGQMQVVCHGFDRATVNLPEATDTIAVPLIFVEDDQALDDTTASQGVPAQQQNVTSSVADFQAAVAPYNAPATVAATAWLASATADYAVSASAAALSNTIDPSVNAKLAAVALSTEAAISAISTDPVGIGTAAIYDALAAAEVVNAACQDLADAALCQGPAVVEYTVTGSTSIAVLAAALYGKDALGYIDQLLSLNAIPDPTVIPTGTVLLVPSL